MNMKIIERTKQSKQAAARRLLKVLRKRVRVAQAQAQFAMRRA
jgi:hypothetical protein